jgi:hypothetical protein
MSNGTGRRVVGYVDGFNLYHGMRSRFGRKWLWLDVEALVGVLRPPDDEVGLVRYFTARVRDDPAGGARQKRYLNGLKAHCTTLKIHLGRYQAKERRCRFCGGTWRTRLRINESMLRRSQLPSEIVTPIGVRLTKPAHWTPGTDGVGSRSRAP